MARFRFSMQNILEIKMKLEEQYQMEYGKAIQARDLQQKEIAEIREMIQNTNHRFFEKQADPFLIRELKAIQDKLSFLRRKEKQAHRTLQELEEVVIQCREKLTRAMQERKTYEILREKALERYLEEEKQAELKRMDEQSSFKFSKK